MKAQVVFFGTGPVAAKSLEFLSAHCDIEAVVTKPRPDHHRGAYPVLDTAQRLGLPCLTARNKTELTSLVRSQSFSSRVGVLIDFGIIVEKATIDCFPLGIVNSHFSLLPEWRGADPITFSILSGQPRTGVSLMLIDEGMDTGPLIAQASYDIRPDETMPSLTAQLIKLSDDTLRRVLPRYLSGTVKPAPQESATIAATATPSYSRKLTKEDGRIDWSKPAEVLEREIRAFQPWPKSYTTLGELRVAILAASVITDSPVDTNPGSITVNEGAGMLTISTGKGLLRIETLQPEGKKEMPIRAFLNGYADRIGTHAA